MHTMRTIVTVAAGALAAAFAVGSAGCYGKWGATRAVYKWNGEVSNKYARSALTWALMIIPVYPVAGALDFLILNPIEFWSGSNPISLEDRRRLLEQGGEWRLDEQPDGTVVALRHGTPVFAVRVDDAGTHIERR
jgi:hypothetical protein